jgi:Domain of unknown function (DUF5668)/Cell wall-active antibiotics response 4TMS YvqF
MMNYRRPSLFWPIILIGAGAILLLSNLHVITGNPWGVIWRLWPLLLIAIGLDILFGRRSVAGSIVGGILGLAVVGIVLWVVIAQPALPGLNFSGNLQTQHIQYPLNNVQSASVSIGFATGTNELKALSDSGNLIEGDLSTYGSIDFTPTSDGSQATVRLNESSGSFGIPFFGDSGEHWAIGLNPKVAYTLDLNMGVGNSTVDLSKLSLSSGKINVGVGQVEVWLPSTGKFSLRIDGGVGNLKIHVPGHIGVHVDLNSGLGSFNAGSRLRSIGDNVYETEGYSSASDQITLNIDAGVGSINIIDSE